MSAIARLCRPPVRDLDSVQPLDISDRPILSPAYRLVLRLEIDNRPGMFAKVATMVGERGCSLGAIDLVEATGATHVRDVTVDVQSEEAGEKLAAALRTIDGIKVRAVSDRTFLVHLGGKIEVKGRTQVRNRDDLSLVYTPGVARVCRAIAENKDLAWTFTMRGNTVAVVSDGTAVLGLGNIGPEGALPVMEGKSMLFSQLAGINAFPLCLTAKDPQTIIDTVVAVAPNFGGINLEDIAAPACFDIERELRRRLDIPVFHDDQHGTAIVVNAALRNAAAVCEMALDKLRVVIVGAGAAGIATARLLHRSGVTHIRLCDRHGIVHLGRTDLNSEKRAVVQELDPQAPAGSISDAVKDAHVFIGLSGPKLLTVEALRTMARPRIVFAMANPEPEIDPAIAAPEVDVLGTGRSDYPNQVNNVLAFPGFFRGLLDAHARSVTTEMELAAANALAATVPAKLRSNDYILPSVFDPQVVPSMARAVAAAARAAGVARKVPRARGAHSPTG